MKRHTIIAWLAICSVTVLLHACSLLFGTPKDDFEVVDRTKPASAPWKYTRTPDLGLTATSQYLVTATQVAIEAEATSQAEATATAAAFTLLATATAEVRENALMAYEYYDAFAHNELDWREGDEDTEFWQGEIRIQDGRYTWQVAEVSETFLTWADFEPVKDLVDFDVALKVRRADGPSHQYCYGLLFRKSSEGFIAGSYILSICDKGYFKLLYYDGQHGWEVLQDWTQSDWIYPDDWNLAEISARGSDFTVFINHQEVLTFSDNRLASGMVAILMDVYARTPGRIEVDWFALQTH